MKKLDFIGGKKAFLFVQDGFFEVAAFLENQDGDNDQDSEKQKEMGHGKSGGK